MINKSIAYRLSIYISLAVIGVFIAFILIYFLFHQQLIKESVQNNAIIQSSKITSTVNRHIIETMEVASNISEQIAYYGEQDHADYFIISLLKKYPKINSIHVNIDSTTTDLKYKNYLAYQQKDSILLFRSNKRFETGTTRQIEYQNLIQGKTARWSEPMMCKRNNVVISSYYKPIYSKGRSEIVQIGEVICELSLFSLNESINSFKVGKKGYAFLLSRKGVFITYPDKEFILTQSVFDAPKRISNLETLEIEQVLNNKNPGSFIVHPSLLNDEKAWLYHTPITENGWVLNFVIPYKELYEPLYLPVLQMLFFSVLGILVIYLLITYITNKQIQPLSNVTQQLKRFDSLTGPAENIPDNEVLQVSESLNYMKSWYDKYLLNQSQEEKKRERRLEDLKQASEIQQSFIKAEYPAFPYRDDVDLHTLYNPARGVSGDLYDYFFIDDDNLVLTMGDVSGKGIPAAFFMSIAQTIIKNNALEPKAKTIVKKANKELYTNNHHQFFLTLFLGILNVKTGELNYCNAAHTASYVLKSNGIITELSQPHGLPLGLYPDKNYNDAKIQLETGDTLILYTDGVTELINENSLQYGNKQFKDNLKSLQGQDPKKMIEKLEHSFEMFKGEIKQSDDISLLILRYQA